MLCFVKKKWCLLQRPYYYFLIFILWKSFSMLTRHFTKLQKKSRITGRIDYHKPGGFKAKTLNNLALKECLQGTKKHIADLPIFVADLAPDW
jgi:hypothetical protein